MRSTKPLLFELSRKGRRCVEFPAGAGSGSNPIDQAYLRASAPALPEVSESDLIRHYMGLSRRAHGVDSGFYPLGSCTMKYNPKINEEAAGLPGFTDIHPLQPEETAQGCLQALYTMQGWLAEITGMNTFTMQPAAGAHGEWTGMAMIKAWHSSRGDNKRTKVLVPDSAHGTNPASAAVAGFEVVQIPSAPDGGVDTEALRRAADETTAALMLTNPSTLGLFETRIDEIEQIVHGAGGLLYYDGANLNAVMGVTRPGDMGFDVVHVNLHKTFSTPHGGGGPGSGPVGCKKALEPFLPVPVVVRSADGSYHLDYDRPQSIGRVKSFYGNFGVILRAMTYILSLGSEGLRQASLHAVLNANYMMNRLKGHYRLPFDRTCMHEFVLSAEEIKAATGCSAMDIAKKLLDWGIHPPTMYFPLIVHEALMIEPTETESKDTLDHAVGAFVEIARLAAADPDRLHAAPETTPVGRLDEVAAARKPRLRWKQD